MSNVTKKRRKQNSRNKSNTKFKDTKRPNNDCEVSTDKVEKPYLSKANDVSWYAQEPHLLKDAASIPYSWPVGSHYNRYNENYTDDGTMSDVSVIPGLFVMELLTGPGISKDNNSAVNIAARNIYSFVRHANSGHSNYDSPDLMIYLLAMDECYMWFYNAVRAYGLMNAYNSQNRYFPKWAIEALGFDFEDIMSNLAQFRYAINAFGVRIASMAIPTGMPIFDRHKWLYSGLYADGTSAKAQMYAYKPYGYRLYSETGSTGGHLTYHKLDDNNLLTVDDFVNIANKMINPILGSEDMNIMSGDILKAYGTSGLVKLPVIDDLYTVIPMYNEEVLSQFQNATMLGEPIITDSTDLIPSADVAQNPALNEGTVLFDPEWSNDPWHSTKVQQPLFADRLINLNLNEVSPEDTMVATRLMNIPTPTTDGTKYFLINGGTELAIRGNMYRLDYDGDNLTLNNTNVQFSGELRFTTQDNGAQLFNPILSYMLQISNLSRFKFHPYASVVMDLDSSSTSRKVLEFWEIDNYAIVTAETLNRMHDVATLSEFHVYQIAKAY